MADQPPRSESVDEDDIDPAEFKPRTQGTVSFGLTLMGLGLAAFLLFDMRDDLAFWFRSAEPIDLGTSTTYFLDRVRDNSLASIQGVPGPVANRFKLLTETYEIVALRGTPVLVRRAPTGLDMPVPPGKPPPPPDQKPFTATGRLLRDTSIPQYEHAFRTLVERGEAVPRGDHLWVLLDGEQPRTGWKVPLMLLALVALLGLNAYSLTRYLRRKAAVTR